MDIQIQSNKIFAPLKKKWLVNKTEEHRNNSGAYQGAKYFSYNGKVLDDIRKEREDN